jgi:hypothetical protein
VFCLAEAPASFDDAATPARLTVSLLAKLAASVCGDETVVAVERCLALGGTTKCWSNDFVGSVCCAGASVRPFWEADGVASCEKDPCVFITSAGDRGCTPTSGHGTLDCDIFLDSSRGRH